MQSLLKFLYYISVSIIVLLPIVGSFVSAKHRHLHHHSASHSFSRQDAHIDHYIPDHHWDIIKNKRLSRPPVTFKLRMIPVIALAFIFSFLGFKLWDDGRDLHYYILRKPGSPVFPRYIAYRTFLI
ncbi:MAG: hypothetical protein ABIN91_12060 [Mucilaginibacter sp.]|uniref:hypothetical protein n=1 Tax=Mucilaginibacter sp. TaxID=1882438 RepID=UPI00326541DC